MEEKEHKRSTDRGNHIGTEKQVLPCKLTPDEVRERGEELASVLGQLKELDARESEFKADLKSKRTPLESQRDYLRDVVNAKQESRGVEVELWADFTTGNVEFIRQDTGECITSRGLRPEERQGKLRGIRGE